MSSRDSLIDASRPLRPGIYAPVPTFFLPESEDLGPFFLSNSKQSHLLDTSDIPTFEKHVTQVALAGAGPVIAGSMGESIHLSQTDRTELICAARRALDNAGLTTVPIIAGTGAGSTRETLQLTRQAASAGADYALIIASGYFSGLLAMNKSALKDYWKEVAEKSTIPIMLYNCRFLLFFELQLSQAVRSRGEWRHRFGFEHYNRAGFGMSQPLRCETHVCFSCSQSPYRL